MREEHIFGDDKENEKVSKQSERISFPEHTDHLFHEVTAIFPPMKVQAYADLVAERQTSGLEEPLWRYQGKMIDGRHRYLACKQLGREPTYHEWDGLGSLVLFVVKLNIATRHLSVTQRALLAVDVEEWLNKEARERQRKGETHDSRS